MISASATFALHYPCADGGGRPCSKLRGPSLRFNQADFRLSCSLALAFPAPRWNGPRTSHKRSCCVRPENNARPTITSCRRVFWRPAIRQAHAPTRSAGRPMTGLARRWSGVIVQLRVRPMRSGGVSRLPLTYVERRSYVTVGRRLFFSGFSAQRPSA